MEKEKKEEKKPAPMTDAELDVAIFQLQELTKKLVEERKAREKQKSEKDEEKKKD